MKMWLVESYHLTKEKQWILFTGIFILCKSSIFLSYMLEIYFW